MFHTYKMAFYIRFRLHPSTMTNHSNSLTLALPLLSFILHTNYWYNSRTRTKKCVSQNKQCALLVTIPTDFWLSSYSGGLNKIAFEQLKAVHFHTVCAKTYGDTISGSCIFGVTQRAPGGGWWPPHGGNIKNFDIPRTVLDRDEIPTATPLFSGEGNSMVQPYCETSISVENPRSGCKTIQTEILVTLSKIEISGLIGTIPTAKPMFSGLRKTIVQWTLMLDIDISKKFYRWGQKVGINRKNT